MVSRVEEHPQRLWGCPSRKVSGIPTELQFTILDSVRDMVGRSQGEKCGYKYVIHSPGGSVKRRH